MFKYFMRVEIRDAVNEAGESEEKFQAALDAIQQWIDDHEEDMASLSSGQLMRGELTNSNGAELLIAFGGRNHESGIVTMLREILALIAKVAPGSFGFAYWMDGNYNYSWKVLVLKRGQITEEDDPFFSPMIPTVEDSPDQPGYWK